MSQTDSRDIGLGVVLENGDLRLRTWDTISREDFEVFLFNRATIPRRKEFERLSAKTVTDLYEELSGRDVSLTLSLGDLRLRRVASSAKILFVHGSRQMFETKRVLPSGVELVHKEPKTFTVSETKKRDEQPREAAFRGILEEFGKDFIDEYGITPDMIREMKLPLEEAISVHESSVYHGILSCVSISAFELTFPADGPLPYPNGHVARERDGMEIYTEWF